MTTLAKLPFKLTARFLGPVFALDGELTKKSQNLIFARNGTGKSFLSRAFRCLDNHGQGKSLEHAPRNLISDESTDEKGSFSFSRGSDVLGMLELAKKDDLTSVQVRDTIFHVFSEDFIHEELREQEYNLDGEIATQITVDSTNIQLKDAEVALTKAQNAGRDALEDLTKKFDIEKTTQLIKKVGIRKQLREYVALSFSGLLETFTEKPKVPKQSFIDILRDLVSLKSIPAEPVYPDFVSDIQLGDIDLDKLDESLQKETSPSSVSEEIKEKIDSHRDFFKIGIDIVDKEHRKSCPFCEQGITAPDPKAVIDAYVDYFSDEEERHKSELRGFYVQLNNKDNQLTEIDTKIVRQKLHFDALKAYMPSMKESSLAESEEAVKLAKMSISALKVAIECKAKALTAPTSPHEDNLAKRVIELNQLIEENNKNVDALSKAVADSDNERKILQRKACEVFEREFAIANWKDIEALKQFQMDEKVKASALTTLEKSSPSTEARVRVADTFDLLLREFFSDKYIFDKNSFVLKRGVHEMSRGSHRTLSDGEKAALAFCYFIACIHRKVTANNDYDRLFLVFDDPVTSMSYDFVFAIAQTLKNLNISTQGEISINPGLIDGNKYKRPELLVLTHSSYFFNISITNKVIDETASFALHLEKGTHKIARLSKYVAPFQEQLKDIYEIANGRDPDHTTGSAIRSVLEAIGRFCRPDKSDSLSNFVQHLATQDGISVKSILINHLCHGSYYDETPPPGDLQLACQETLSVVELYAVGQLEVIKSVLAAK